MKDFEQSFVDSAQVRENLAMFPNGLRQLAEILLRTAWRDGALCHEAFEQDLSIPARDAA